MANLTKGYIYFTNYMTGNSAGAQSCGTGDIGTHWFRLKYPTQFNRVVQSKGSDQQLPSKAGMIMRQKNMPLTLTFKGDINTGSFTSNAKETYYAENYIQHNQNVTSPDYAFVVLDTSVYELFPGKSGSELNYCRGWIESISTVVDYGENQLKRVMTVKFNRVWSM